MPIFKPIFSQHQPGIVQGYEIMVFTCECCGRDNEPVVQSCCRCGKKVGPCCINISIAPGELDEPICQECLHGERVFKL